MQKIRLVCAVAEVVSEIRTPARTADELHVSASSGRKFIHLDINELCISGRMRESGEKALRLNIRGGRPKHFP